MPELRDEKGTLIAKLTVPFADAVTSNIEGVWRPYRPVSEPDKEYRCYVFAKPTAVKIPMGEMVMWENWKIIFKE